MNGAVTYETSGKACLDLFALAGGIRYRKKEEQERLFERAYIEDPELAMKLLFYIRDVRGGLGERDTFRTMLRFAAGSFINSAVKNVRLISEYGRFDDLLCLLDTPARNEAVRVIREQMDQDLKALKEKKAGRADVHISLLAKWLPSINASSRRTRKQARVLARALGMSEPAYRKALSGLREALSLAERRLTERKAERLCYEAVPAGALLRYRNAFAKHDKDRFTSYLKDAMNGEKKVHCGTLFPYEIIRPLMSGNSCSFRWKSDPSGVLDLLWAARKDEVGGQNAIAVVDTSGSMYWHKEGTVVPALIAQSLGLYFAEHCRGTFHNTFITFESRPHLIEVKGNTLGEKLRFMSRASWGGSTDLEAVFTLLLETALKTNAPQEDMPSTLYIISDMEFNQAVDSPGETVYESARGMFERHGYRMPAVVFHNVNSWQMQTPVRSDTKGTAMTSGASVSVMKDAFDGNITPLAHMLRVLKGPRYKAVHA